MIGTANIPVPLLVAGVGLVGIALGWAANGIGFFTKRKLTGASKTERAAYLNSLTDLAEKLRANGMTLSDVHAFESVMSSAPMASSKGAEAIIRLRTH